MKISDVDFEREFVVFRDTKNTRDHYFPLTLGVAVILHRRIEYNNLPCGRDIRKALKGEQIEIAMNHADIKSDVTQGYVMVKPRLKMLRPIYLAHERRVFKAAGLDAPLPEDPKQANQKESISALLALAKEDPKLRPVQFTVVLLLLHR